MLVRSIIFLFILTLSSGGSVSLAFITYSSIADGEMQSPQDSVFQIGEELTYNVSYMSIDIGQIRVKQVEKQ
ncbi:MAG: hypothetical protein HY800_02135 [Ignavibacteriales bacterium]|nr:hypothetical protein [Ignavibacteriales bacterium]